MVRTLIAVVLLVGCGCRKAAPRVEASPSVATKSAAVVERVRIPLGSLPKSTVFVVALDSVSAWSTRLDRIPIVRRVRAGWVEHQKRVRSRLRFDPADPAAWTAVGLDPDAPAGVAILDQRRDAVAFGRVLDSARLESRLAGGYVVRGDYAIVPLQGPTKRVLDALVPSGSGLTLPAGSGRAAAGFVSLAGVRADRDLRELMGGTITFAVDATGSQLTGRARVDLSPMATLGSVLRSGAAGRTLRHAVWEVPTLWLAARTEPHALGSQVLGPAKRLRRTATALGIDFDADVLGALDGTVEVAHTQPLAWESLPDWSRGVHLVLGLSAPDRLQQAIDRLTAAIKSEVLKPDGQGGLVVTQPGRGTVHARVIGKRMVLTTEPKLFDRLDSREGGFPARLDPTALRDLVAADASGLFMVELPGDNGRLALNARLENSRTLVVEAGWFQGPAASPTHPLRADTPP